MTITAALAETMRDARALDQELLAAGAWVFSGAARGEYRDGAVVGEMPAP